MHFLHGRCYSEDKDRWIKQAQNEGIKLMPWVVKILNEACDMSESDKMMKLIVDKPPLRGYI